MKHVNKFANMGGRKCQVVTSTELTEDLISKYKKGLGMAYTHTEEPLGNDIARPATTDKGSRPMSRINELLEAWNGGYYSTLEVHELIDTLKLERDQMTARCARLEEFVGKIAAGDMPDVVNRRANARFILSETKPASLSAVRADTLDELIKDKSLLVEWVNGSRNQAEQVCFSSDIIERAAALREGE